MANRSKVQKSFEFTLFCIEFTLLNQILNKLESNEHHLGKKLKRVNCRVSEIH